jgi:hypothetical protein
VKVILELSRSLILKRFLEFRSRSAWFGMVLHSKEQLWLRVRFTEPIPEPKGFTWFGMPKLSSVRRGTEKQRAMRIAGDGREA